MTRERKEARGTDQEESTEMKCKTKAATKTKKHPVASKVHELTQLLQLLTKLVLCQAVSRSGLSYVFVFLLHSLEGHLPADTSRHKARPPTTHSGQNFFTYLSRHSLLSLSICLSTCLRPLCLAWAAREEKDVPAEQSFLLQRIFLLPGNTIERLLDI